MCLEILREVSGESGIESLKSVTILRIFHENGFDPCSKGGGLCNETSRPFKVNVFNYTKESFLSSTRYTGIEMIWLNNSEGRTFLVFNNDDKPISYDVEDIEVIFDE